MFHPPAISSTYQAEDDTLTHLDKNPLLNILIVEQRKGIVFIILLVVS